MGYLGGSYIPVEDTTETHGEQFTRIVRDAEWFFYGVNKPNISEAPTDGYRDQSKSLLSVFC